MKTILSNMYVINDAPVLKIEWIFQPYSEDHMLKEMTWSSVGFNFVFSRDKCKK